MNILTHCYANFEVFKNRKLSPEEESHLVLGSFIADVHEFKIVEKKQTHFKGPEFLKSLAPQYHYLGAGLILHGENPQGLDYYAHQQYIPSRQKDIIRIMGHYKKCFPKKMEVPMVAHLLIEFCFEYLTAEKNPRLIKKVTRALEAPLLPRAVYNFSNFFNINRKHTKTILKLNEKKIAKSFITNFGTIKGTTHNFQKFVFLKQYRDNVNKPNWLNRATKSSYGFLRFRIRERQFERMIARCIEMVRKDYEPFMDHAIKNLKKMARQQKL